MAIQVSIQTVNAFDNIVTVSGLLLITGNYVAGGDTIDFTKAVADPNFTGLTPEFRLPVLRRTWTLGA